MKYILSFILVSAMATAMLAQTMKWVPMAEAAALGPCSVATGKKQQLLCYALVYTPAVSGTLTSYTTGFHVSCTSKGSPLSISQSCTMTNNVRLLNGCQEYKLVLMNTSGNGGTPNTSKVEANKPTTLHQVCFTIPYGESITIKEDPSTDLTTSIDISSGVFQTEYPEYTEINIVRIRPDVGRPLWLDFKVISAGDFTSQLDWSTVKVKDDAYFNIERSIDGNQFEVIGRQDAMEVQEEINSYQFLDKQAAEGMNYYRLEQVNENGTRQYSPVRKISFRSLDFVVSISPNPADDYLIVDIQTPSVESTIKLIDATGRVVMDEKNDQKLLKTRLNIEGLHAGIYTLIVESGDDTFTEKVVILE